MLAAVVGRETQRDRSSGAPDSHLVGLDNHNAGGQVVEIKSHQSIDERVDDRRRLLVSDAQHQDPCMATGWMEANVCQTSIQGDEESPCTPCRTYHVDIYGPSKPFISNGINLEARRLRRHSSISGQVLVELQPHPAGRSGRSSSLARSAA